MLLKDFFEKRLHDKEEEIDDLMAEKPSSIFINQPEITLFCENCKGDMFFFYRNMSFI